MIQNKIIKLKKYLFLISILFFVLSLTHLAYTYVYSDSKVIPIKWWTVSEWLVWAFPSLNPLKPLTWNNKYIVSLLYRSLLKFDLEENKIVWDLATCDISNLLNIECYLKDNIFWSNWEAITSDDVISTYEILKNTWVNKITSSLIQDTEIIKNNNVIIFKNKKKDVNFLNIFFQPILKKDTIDGLWEDIIFWNFPTTWQIYSWEFKIWNISSDLTIWITKIFLDINEYFYKWNISKLVINIFPNTNSLIQNKETVNIFNDVDNVIWTSIPRLENHKYKLPQYVSLFINQNNISDINLRNYILEKINNENLIKILWETKFEAVKNPYLTDTNISNEISNKNFEKIISDLWYIKKAKIIENYLPIINSSTWTINLNETDIVEKVEDKKEIIINDNDLSIDKFQQESKFIIKPTYVDKYNFITKDDVLLEWIAGKNISEVYINDYKLANFKSGNNNFYYRLKESIWSLKEWINRYKIYFVENWTKVFKEEINFLYYKNKSTLDTETKKFIKILYENEQKNLQEKEIINQNNNKELENQKTVKIQKEVDEKKILENQKELEKISNIDAKFYYNDKLEKFTLNLFYLNAEKELETTALFIKNSLLEIWINVELNPITLTDLRETLSEKNNYDMVLSWVNLWFFDYNIFPYFHSSQVKNWYNFSNIKKTSLDILLEDLKSEIKSPEETNKIKEKVLDILKKEQIIKTLYTPKINLLIDKNIKNVVIPSKLISGSDRKEIFKSIYTKEEKIIKFENKWVIDFFTFLFKKIND